MDINFELQNNSVDMASEVCRSRRKVCCWSIAIFCTHSFGAKKKKKNHQHSESSQQLSLSKLTHLALITIGLDGEVVGNTVVVVEILHEFVVIALSSVGE